MGRRHGCCTSSSDSGGVSFAVVEHSKKIVFDPIRSGRGPAAVSHESIASRIRGPTTVRLGSVGNLP